MKFKEAITYDDMLIVPQYSDITSRSEVDITSRLGHRELRLPVIASNVIGIKQIIIDNVNGFLFNENNSIDLSGKIEKLRSSRERRRIGKNAFEYIKKNHNLKIYLRNLKQILNDK